MRRLAVWNDQSLVGHLIEAPENGGELAFEYSSDWLMLKSAMPIGWSLPLDAKPIVGEQVRAFFENLLPEGGVRQFIAQAEHISEDNVFGLLERFGADTAGALSILPLSHSPQDALRYRPVTPEQIRDMFATSRGIPLPSQEGDELVRMSLSGAQDKLTVFVRADGQMALPLGSAPSSHILKPSPRDRSTLPHTAVNEAFSMLLARAIGLHVPDVTFLADLGAVLIARYDRWTDESGRLRRLHQNDLCQAMGLPSSRKYESEGGPSFAQCVEAVVKHSAQPAQDKLRMLQWLAYNLAIGNMDSHAKNLSMLVSNSGVRLAPFYDLVCTTVYPRLSTRFAFKIGGENRPGWIRDRHWDRLAIETNTKPQFIRNARKDVADRIARALPTVAKQLKGLVTDSGGVEIIDRVEAEIRRGAGRLKAIDAESDAEPGQNESAIPDDPVDKPGESSNHLRPRGG